jgi:hypothetical protein
MRNYWLLLSAGGCGLLQVRGLAYADAAQVASSVAGGSPVDAAVIGTSALSAGESMLIFGFAAAAVELAMKEGHVRPFNFEFIKES